MTISRVQAKGFSNPTSPIAYASNNTLGNLLICVYRSSIGTTISDSNHNNWLKAIAQANGATRECGIWYAFNCAAGANSVSLNGSFQAAAVIAEYSGLGAGTLGSTNSAQSSTNGQVYNSGTVSSTKQSLFIGAVENETENGLTDTPSGGLTDWTNGDGNCFLSDLISNTPASGIATAGTLSTSVQWAADIAIFYPTTSGVPNSLMMMGCGI